MKKCSWGEFQCVSPVSKNMAKFTRAATVMAVLVALAAAGARGSIDDAPRSVQRLVGGHMRLPPAHGPNTWHYDDTMQMAGAGEGKGSKRDDADEDIKTLSDQVAEGKYGLIQKEIFQKPPKRPGVVSYERDPETGAKDNENTLGGLKKEEIWLAEDHLLVLKGGSFPEHDSKDGGASWPPIDAFEAPRRQVKLPQRPVVPPPFPVRLSDDGPLVFLTPNGSVPAPYFPPYATPGAGNGPVPPPSFPYPPGAAFPPSAYPGNSTSGGAPLPVPPFPFLPGNASEDGQYPPFPFPFPMNGSLPEGFPPGAAILPPPGNQTDLYDEDDPSIYYPPPYNFSYRADNDSVPAGPLVPGIVLPPPPDFFAPLDEDKPTTLQPTTTNRPSAKPKPAAKRPVPVYRIPQKARPVQHAVDNSIDSVSPNPRPFSASEPVQTRPPPRVVYINQQNPRTHKQTEKPIEKPAVNTVSKIKVNQDPPSYQPVSIIYDYPEQYETNSVTPSAKPFVVYGPPERPHGPYSKTLVTSTPVPLRAYYADGQSISDSYTKQNPSPPLYYRQKQPDKSLASFYFYEETPKVQTPVPQNYYDSRNYYNTGPANQQQTHQNYYNQKGGFTPTINQQYRPLEDEASILLVPQRQGSRTLTQEYFSIQKPNGQQAYARPDLFYQQIADIQQTIDYYTTHRPKQSDYSQRPSSNYKQKPQPTSRPVYQFSYQSKQRPEQNTFRVPKLDSEPFRPMVSYSKPFNLQGEYQTTPKPGQYHQQYLIEKVKVTTETPSSSKYYPSKKQQDEDYEDTAAVQPHNDKIYQNSKPARPQAVRQSPKLVGQIYDPRLVGQIATPNPVDHAYYTKQDERLFDDITKNYFTIFGKKIEGNNHDIGGIAVTDPIRPLEVNTIKTPINNAINIQYANDGIDDSYQPNPVISLEGDTLVNYRQPRPYIEPESEFIPIVNPELQSKYRAEQQFKILQEQAFRERQHQALREQNQGLRGSHQSHNELLPGRPEVKNPKVTDDRPPYTGEQLDLFRPVVTNVGQSGGNPIISLAGDTNVNYNRPLPPINPDSEFIDPSVNAAGEGRPGSFVSYKLPGEGAHVYFLTPQAVKEARGNIQRYTYRTTDSRIKRETEKAR